MPRYPRIYSESLVPSSLPTRDVPLGSPAAAALAGAGQVVEQTGLALYDQQAKITAELRKADAALEVDQAVSELKIQFAQQQEELKAQGVHPDAYAPELGKRLQRLGQGLTGTMRYPEAQAAFGQQLERFRAEQGVLAIRTGWEMKYNQIKFGEDIQQRQNENDYVANPTQENLDRLFAVPQRGLVGGYRSEAEARAMFAGSMTRVQHGLIEKEFQNPANQQRVIESLLDGKHPWLSRDDQFAKAHALMSRRDAKEAREQAQAEKAAKAFKEQAVADLWRQAERKTKPDGTPLTVEDILAASERLGLSRIDIGALTTALAKPPDEAPSDRVTFDRVSADVDSYSPRTSEQEIKRLHAAGLLNTKDRNDLLSKRTSRITHLVEHGETLMGRQQSQAEKQIRSVFGIPDIIPPGFDPGRLQAADGALRDLSAQSAYFPPQPGEAPGLRRPPLEIVDQVITRWKPIAGAQIDLGLEQAGRVARYKTMAELDAARAGMTPAQYRQERDLTLRYIEAAKAKAEADQRAAQTPGKKPGKPGTFSRGTELPKVE